MTKHTILWLAALAAWPACSKDSPHAAAPIVSADSHADAHAPAPETQPSEPSTERSTASCGADAFVACASSGPDCARRGGSLIEEKACFDHAADACDALSCEHGCNIHHGVPKEVHCAPNASSSSNMQRCGGIANWACPEGMRCEVGSGFDAMGRCVTKS